MRWIIRGVCGVWLCSFATFPAYASQSYLAYEFSDQEFVKLSDAIVIGRISEVVPTAAKCVTALFRVSVTEVLAGKVNISSPLLVGVTDFDTYETDGQELLLFLVAPGEAFSRQCTPRLSTIDESIELFLVPRAKASVFVVDRVTHSAELTTCGQRAALFLEGPNHFGSIAKLENSCTKYSVQLEKLMEKINAVRASSSK